MNKPTARKILNPQPVIAKKRAALEAVGGGLVFNNGVWEILDGPMVLTTLTSQELASSSEEELVDLIA
jgi:hypothetical protein